jgi:hypothetical protein
MSARRISGTSPKKSGRALATSTIAIREALLELPVEYEKTTSRGAFYLLVARGIVEKAETGYRKVQRQALILRREGLLKWESIADGTRWVHAPEPRDSTEDALQDAARLYRRKSVALAGRQDRGLAREGRTEPDLADDHGWGVRLMISRGQSFETYLYNAAQEARDAWEKERIVEQTERELLARIAGGAA